MMTFLCYSQPPSVENWACASKEMLGNWLASDAQLGGDSLCSGCRLKYKWTTLFLWGQRNGMA